jgi:hypothetical protein
MEQQQTSEIEKATTVLKKDTVLGVLGLEIVELRVLVCKPFYDFLKEYLQFFGTKHSVENVCTLMINDNVTRLYQELEEFIGDPIAVRYADTAEWARKHEHLDLCADQGEEDKTEEEK